MSLKEIQDNITKLLELIQTQKASQVLPQLPELMDDSELFLKLLLSRVKRSGYEEAEQEARRQKYLDDQLTKPKHMQVTTIYLNPGPGEKRTEVSYTPLFGSYQDMADRYIDEAIAQGEQASYERHQHMMIITLSDRTLILRETPHNFAGYHVHQRSAFPDIYRPCKNCEYETTHSFVEMMVEDVYIYACSACDARVKHDLRVKQEA